MCVSWAKANVQDSVCPCLVVGISAFIRLFESITSNEGLEASDNLEIGICLCIFTGLDFATKFVNVSQRLQLAIDEGVSFRKQLVLHAYAGNTPLFELRDELPTHMSTDKNGGTAAHGLRS